jgi:beta-galactosidase
MHLGCAWYPEHWPEERWDEDLRLMRACHMTVVRVAEFAWSRLEPADGVFACAWLERAVARAAAHGLQVVIGTPTAAPPAWLTAAHPEVLPLRGSDGRVVGPGHRCQYRAASAVYRRYGERITAELAKRFGRHPAVIGWQTDNEFGGFLSQDTETVAQFREWLRRRHGSLERINEQWSGAYWSQDYQDWSHISAPLHIGPNPGLVLDWHRFQGDLFADFQRGQIRAIRAHAEARQWITHNFWPRDEMPRAPLAADLDRASWDAYVGGSPLDLARNGLDCDRIRGLSRLPFWIMETQPMAVNWDGINASQPPGAVRAMAWHMVGHGAEAILYWQWRSAPGGQEQYHGTLLAQDGTPRPVYDEVALLGAELQRLAPQLDSCDPRPRVAIIDRWQDRSALRFQPHHRGWDPAAHAAAWYEALQRHGVGCAVLEQLDDLTPYAVIVAPHLHLLDDTTAAQLRAFVARGGHLVLGQRSGMKDQDNRLHDTRGPGPVADLAGVRVRDFHALDQPVSVAGTLGSGTAQLFGEDLLVQDADIWLRWGADAGWMAGQPAVSHRPLPDGGSCTYAGCWADGPLLGALLGRILDAAGVPRTAVPSGVEMQQRGALRIAVNATAAAVSLPLTAPALELLRGESLSDTLYLPAWGVAVLA